MGNGVRGAPYSYMADSDWEKVILYKEGVRKKGSCLVEILVAHSRYEEISYRASIL